MKKLLLILLSVIAKLEAVQAEPARLLQPFPPPESVVEAKTKSVPASAWTPMPGDSSERNVNRSPYATAADFAKHAMELREQEISQVPPLSEPTTLEPVQPAMQRYPWKTNIVTTVFWVGEKQVHESVWDKNWERNYGGVDNPDPSARRSYLSIAFIPRQNPFYCALPYNDVTHGQFKPEAPLVIPWFKQAYIGPGQSVCWHRWVAIRKGDRTCYAEWEDCGPFRTDHFQYVFGNERPKPNASHGAGLSVSPAVRDYLGLAPTDVTDWQFVEVRDVPPGPWRSYGENNHFVIARRQTQEGMTDQLQDNRKAENPPSEGTQDNVSDSFSEAQNALARNDYKSAVRLFQKSADGGATAGQEALGWLYARGKGVPQDYAKAVEFYQKAADQGYAPAQSRLASSYARGEGVPQDYKRAVELFEKAAAQGDAHGQDGLGSLYKLGKGVPQDYKKAVELYQKAADKGYAPAQTDLAILYTINGLGKLTRITPR